MPWENPMEREHLCPECKDEVRIETFDASGCYPDGGWVECDDCPRCEDCKDFVSRFDRSGIFYDMDEGIFYCPECKPKPEPSAIERAAELTRTILKQSPL